MEYVDRSSHLLALITVGYTESPNCIRELLRAVLTKKQITLMLDNSEGHGGMKWPEVEAGLAKALTCLSRWELDVELQRWYKDGKTTCKTPTLEMIVDALQPEQRLVYFRLKLFQDPVRCRRVAPAVVALCATL